MKGIERRDGFTLIDVVTVIVVLGILSVIIAVNQCSGSNISQDTNDPPSGCGSTSERYVRIAYSSTTGRLTGSAPAPCSS